MIEIQKRAGELAKGDIMVFPKVIFPKVDAVVVEDIMNCGEQVLIFCDNGYCYNWFSKRPQTKALFRVCWQRT